MKERPTWLELAAAVPPGKYLHRAVPLSLEEKLEVAMAFLHRRINGLQVSTAVPGVHKKVVGQWCGSVLCAAFRAGLLVTRESRRDRLENALEMSEAIASRRWGL